MSDKRILYVAGLPRSGSTLMCQLLSTHPDIDCPGHSSPLLHAIGVLRRELSDNDFLLAQLDADFDRTYRRLVRAFHGFVDGWFAESREPWVVDKNRGWLPQVQWLAQLDPDFRMVVCVRELSQIYGSIEAQHERTIFLDFPDHTAHLSRHARAAKGFGPDGVVGAPLRAIESLRDEPAALQERLFYVVYEHLMADPQDVMASLYRWLGLPVAPLDLEDLPVRPHESDSYYRFKYPHETRSRLAPTRRHEVPARIERELRAEFAWFYRLFYPSAGGE